MTQLTQREFQSLFEDYCDSYFALLRDVVTGVRGWEDAVGMLEAGDGAGWKLIFRMLARGSLYKDDGVSKLKVTCSRLVRDARDRFGDLNLGLDAD